jgi:hypothetical protein
MVNNTSIIQFYRTPCAINTISQLNIFFYVRILGNSFSKILPTLQSVKMLLSNLGTGLYRYDGGVHRIPKLQKRTSISAAVYTMPVQFMI